MKRLLTLLLGAGPLFAYAQNDAIQSADVIIRHVNVIPMTTEKVLHNQVVCISDGKISYIGKDHLDSQPHTKATIVDGKGEYLMPGMADMHCHLPKENMMQRFCALNLAAGVTVVRSMRGKEWHPKYAHPDFPSPKLYLGAPIMPYDTTINSAYAESLVKGYKEQGFQFLKIIALKDSDSFNEIMAQAKKYDMPVCGHWPANVNPDVVLNSGYNSLEHLDWQAKVYDSTGGDYFKHYLSLAKQNHIYHCPTMDYYQVVFRHIPEEQLRKRVGMEYIPDSTKEEWSKYFADGLAERGAAAVEQSKQKYEVKRQKELKMLKQMADMNMPLLLDADPDIYSVAGFNMIEGMKVFKEAGLSNYKILQSATSNAAAYFHEEEKWGTVEKGKCANCILLENNPLEDLNAVTNVQGVFLDDKYYSRQDLRAALN